MGEVQVLDMTMLVKIHPGFLYQTELQERFFLLLHNLVSCEPTNFHIFLHLFSGNSTIKRYPPISFPLINNVVTFEKKDFVKKIPHTGEKAYLDRCG